MQKLPNGQTLVVQENHSNPIVTIYTWVRTCSINETDGNSGVAHFLEHLFFKGTKKHPVGEFDRILESKGGIINAATSKDFTHYYITLPSNYFEIAMDFHADMLMNPYIFITAFLFCMTINIASAWLPARWALKHSIADSLNSKK